MEILQEKEMLEYKGGVKITIGLVSIIAAVGSFILGVIDGLSNPKKCVR